MKTVKIYPEDNSIIVDDQYDTTEFTFFPSKKNFTLSSSIKDDVFYNYQTVEYKINSSPIELWAKVLEMSHEPPLEYSIRDGVVLESELMENKFIPRGTIEGLKKEVEWNRVSVLANPEINLYILSLHPEIISKDEFRRFLRQSIERIKVGVMKAEEAVKSDDHGLRVQAGEYGKMIWYLWDEEEQNKMSANFKLDEKERESSEYSKRSAYATDFNKTLFTEGTPKYVGISENEFKTSDHLIELIQGMLGK
jgi:hypothetical protein